MKSRNHLVVFCAYYPPHVGGVEQFVLELNRRLVPEYQVTIVTSHLPLSSPLQEQVGDCRIIRLPCFELIPNFPVPCFWDGQFWKLIRKVWVDRADVVFSHTRFFVFSVLAGFWATAQKVRWVHVEHGSDFVRSGSAFVRFVAYLYDRSIGFLVLKNASYVVAVSGAVARFVRRLAGRDCTLIYRGVDLKKYQSVVPDDSFKKRFPGKTIFLYAGRLIEGKGVQDLITALSKLREQSWVCCIAGDGPYRRALEEQARKQNILSSVVFAGEVPHATLLSLLSSCDVVVNPSYTEGLPTVVLEAVALKKTVIATDVGGTQELFARREFLYSPGDIPALLDLLSRCALGMRSAYANDHYQLLVSRFRWDTAVAEMARLIG